WREPRRWPAPRAPARCEPSTGDFAVEAARPLRLHADHVLPIEIDQLPHIARQHELRLQLGRNLHLPDRRGVVDLARVGEHAGRAEVQVDPLLGELLIAGADEDAGDVHRDRLAFDRIRDFEVRVSRLGVFAAVAAELDREVADPLIEHLEHLVLALLDGREGLELPDLLEADVDRLLASAPDLRRHQQPRGALCARIRRPGDPALPFRIPDVLPGPDRPGGLAPVIDDRHRAEGDAISDEPLYVVKIGGVRGRACRRLGHAVPDRVAAFENVEVDDVEARPTALRIRPRPTLRRAAEHVALLAAELFDQRLFNMPLHDALLVATPDAHDELVAGLRLGSRGADDGERRGGAGDRKSVVEGKR